jgi:hypothetical protein
MSTEDGQWGPRTYFAIEIFNARDDKKALREIAKREFEEKMALLKRIQELESEDA